MAKMNDDVLKRSIAEKAKTVGTVPGKSALAEVLIDYIEPNRLTLDMLSMWMPTETVNPGEELKRIVRRGRYPVRTMTPGAKHLTDVLSNVEQTVYFYNRLIAGTSHSLWEIQSGEVGSVDQMRTDLRADIFDSLTSRVFNLLSTVWNSVDTPDNYTNVGGILNSAALDNAIDNMRDNGQNIRAIIGTARALRPLYDFAQFRQFELSGTATDAVGFKVEEAFNEYTNSRRVSRYTGIPVIELPQLWRRGFRNGVNTGDPFKDERIGIPDNKVLILSEDVGRIGIMGGTTYQDYTDPTTQPPNYVLHAYQAYGMYLDNVEGISVLEVTPA